jgi:kynurenine formamidase
MRQKVLSYFRTLSNWGRWGTSDRLGTLNLIDADKRRSAAERVHHGIVVSCAWTVDPAWADPVFGAPQRLMVRTGTSTARTRGGDHFGASLEYIGMVFHGRSVTHLDGLAHGAWDGKLYNGVPSSSITAEHGSAVLAVADAAEGIVTRGVLLDVASVHGADRLPPSKIITPKDLAAAERYANTEVAPGDAVILRTGYQQVGRPVHGGDEDVDMTSPKPGWTAECLPWLHEKQVAVIAHDTTGDSRPSRVNNVRIPVHAVGLAAMGLWLVDNCNLNDLRRTCEELSQWEFLFVVAPLRIIGGTGSPVNPLAIF